MTPEELRGKLDRVDQIIASCPTIYPEREHRGGAKTRYPLCGFDCPVGWLDLVAELSRAIEDLVRETEDPTTVEQVKEKFGGLRFYVNHATDPVYALIASAESASFRICEACGAPGRTRGGGWIRTLCDAHAGDHD